MVPSPTPIPAFSERIVAVAAHAMHCLALTPSGRLYTFGHGGCGRLGHGDEEARWVPTRVDALVSEAVIGIAAGQQHSLAVTQHGDVYTWGSATQGKLGHGARPHELLPRRVKRLGGKKKPCCIVAAGQQHSLVVTHKGGLYTFGYGVHGQLGHGTRETVLEPTRVRALASQGVVVHAAGGESHSLAVTNRGEVFSFGGGEDGKLGHRDLEDRLLPMRIAFFAAPPTRRVLAVAAGASHSLVLVEGGHVYSFGNGEYGKLGHGDTRFQWAAKRIEALASETVVAIACGATHSLASVDDGNVFGCGSGGVDGLDPLIEVPPTKLGSAGNEYILPLADFLKRQTWVPKPFPSVNARGRERTPSDTALCVTVA